MSDEDVTKRYLTGTFYADKMGGYIFCKPADGKSDLMFAQVRGWGSLQYGPKAAETQDAHLQFIVDALNEKVAREKK